jgi:hypothetical protein
MKIQPIVIKAVLAALLTAGTLLAQEPAAKPSPRPRPASEKPEPRSDKPEPPARPGQLANVRIDVKITDQRTGQPPVSKTVSLTVADRRDGFVRAAANDMGAVPLNVDASPVIEGGRIRLGFGLQYSWIDEAAASGEARARSRRDVQQRLGLVLEDGKTVLASQSTDPLSDRRVSLEVTATILR